MAFTDFKGLSILKTTDIADVMKQSATENYISKSGNVGTSWAWSGSSLTLAKGLVVLAWYGAFGVATFTKFGS